MDYNSSSDALARAHAHTQTQAKQAGQASKAALAQGKAPGEFTQLRFSPTFQCYTSLPFYASLLLELQTIASFLDNCHAGAREVVWAQLFELIQASQARCSRPFQPILKAWLESPTINLLAIELLYLSFAAAIYKKPDLISSNLQKLPALATASQSGTAAPSSAGQSSSGGAPKSEWPSQSSTTNDYSSGEWPGIAASAPSYSYPPGAMQPAKLQSTVGSQQHGMQYSAPGTMQQSVGGPGTLSHPSSSPSPSPPPSILPVSSSVSERSSATPMREEKTNSHSNAMDVEDGDGTNTFRKLVALQQWIPQLDALDPSEKKKVMNACTILPLYRAEDFGCSSFRDTINGWATNILVHMNSISVLYSAITYLRSNGMLNSLTSADENPSQLGKRKRDEM